LAFNIEGKIGKQRVKAWVPFDLIICVPFPLSSRVLSPTRFFLPTPFPLSDIQTNTSLSISISLKKEEEKEEERNSVQKR